MKLTNKFLFNILSILAWLTCIGLIVKAGSILISYCASITKPEASKVLYHGLDLSVLYEYSFPHYSLLLGYTIIILFAQAYIAYQVSLLLVRANVISPFRNSEVHILRRISLTIVAVWSLSILFNAHIWLIEKNIDTNLNYITTDFIFVAGLVYVLALMFERGVALQIENELTI